MEGHRFHRVAEAIREELTEMIAYEMDDPRLNGVTVVDVQVASDLRKAAVSIALPTQGVEGEQMLEALRNAKGFLRSELSLRLDLYRTPELYFNSALNLGPPERVTHILKRIRKGRPKD